MADRVDPRMQAVQPTTRDSVGDRVAAEAELGELPSRDHPVLAAGQLGDRHIPPTSLHPIGYNPRKCRLVGHATTVTRPDARVALTTARMCDVYGPGVRSTAASAVAASASRIAAPSRALERART